jgi:hypothetical protein
VGGWISGIYPAYRVRNGDHFISEIGCIDGARNCDVTFELDAQVSNGTLYNLGSWREVLDGQGRVIDIDLSSLAGSNVQFVLTAYNNGNAGTASAYWFVPSVRNRPSTEPGASNPAAQAARSQVAQAVGIAATDLVVTAVQPATWTDSCLNIGSTDQNCSPASVAGYKVMLSYGGRTFEAHTNGNGSQVFWREV